MKEMWKPIKGFEGRYEVSNLGNVRSFIMRGNGKRKVSDTPQKYIKPLGDKNGYRQFAFSDGEKKIQKKIHRVVLESFVGDCPDGMECCHINGIKSDNRLENLRWDTHRNNQVKDGGARGIIGSGENNPMAKIKAETVFSIRTYHCENPHVSQSELADIFGLRREHISKILRRERWAHI